MYSKDLAQLIEEGKVKDYVAKFQRLVLMESDVIYRRLIALVVQGLAEPLKAVRSFNSNSLQHAITVAFDSEDSMTKNNFFVYANGPYTNPHMGCKTTY